MSGICLESATLVARSISGWDEPAWPLRESEWSKNLPSFSLQRQFSRVGSAGSNKSYVMSHSYAARLSEWSSPACNLLHTTAKWSFVMKNLLDPSLEWLPSWMPSSSSPIDDKGQRSFCGGMPFSSLKTIFRDVNAMGRMQTGADTSPLFNGYVVASFYTIIP